MGNKREEFVKQYQVDVLPFMKDRKTRGAKEKEVYKSKNNQLNKVRRKRLKKPVKRIATIGLAGLIAFGGYKAYSAYNEYQKENTPITLDQALQNGESLESLKIDNTVKNELEDIKEELGKEDISNSDLMGLSIRINELQFDTIKTKLANTLGEEESDITLHTGVASEGKTKESVEVKGGEKYTNKEFLKNENTISSEISDYIKEIGDMQGLMQELQEGDFKRDDILSKYKKLVKSTDQMAASKITVDKNGNISVEYTKVKDLKENNKETGKVNATREIDDDEMEL